MLEHREYKLPLEVLSIAIDTKIYGLYNSIKDCKVMLGDIESVVDEFDVVVQEDISLRLQQVKKKQKEYCADEHEMRRHGTRWQGADEECIRSILDEEATRPAGARASR
jgi:hypothetical protein